MSHFEFSLDKSAIRHSFDHAAEHYDGAAQLQREIGVLLLDQLGDIDYRSKWVLDAGSGTGYCTRKLAQNGAWVIACDIAPSMLYRARSTSDPGIGYVCSDIETLALRDASVDIVVSNLALQWCVNLDLAFGNFSRILRPGGILAFSSFGPRTLNELRDAWREVDGQQRVNRFYEARQVTDAMMHAGMSNARVESKIRIRGYANVHSLLSELKQLGAHNVRLGRSRGLTGKHRLRQMLDAYYRLMVGEKIIATYEVLFGFARKELE